ncbi:MAG: hypothetical protein ACP5IV_08000 [Caldisericia bacterium]
MPLYEMKLEYVDINNKNQNLSDDAQNFLVEHSTSKLMNEDGEIEYIFISPEDYNDIIDDLKYYNNNIKKEVKEFLDKFVKDKKDDVMFSVV